MWPNLSCLAHSAGKTGGRLARGGEDGRGWGCCPLPRGAGRRARPPSPERSGAPPQHQRRRGQRGLRWLRWLRGAGRSARAGPGNLSGSPARLRILSGRALPFLPPWKTSRRACCFFKSLHRTIRQNLVRRARSFRRGQHFSSCPPGSWGPSAAPASEPSGRSWVGRSARVTTGFFLTRFALSLSSLFFFF